jgi:hypothetical protein
MEVVVKSRERGRKRPADAELILAQVKKEFGNKMDELGAKRAAVELNVCLASFYNYVNGKTLPDLEVLRRANTKWAITWKHMVLGFLRAVREEDVEVVRVGREGTNLLKVALTIRFSA